MAVPEEHRTSPRDDAWMLVAVLAWILVVVNLVVGVVSLAFFPGMPTIQGFGGALGCWWFARGALLRTSTRRPAPGAPVPWSEPVLTERRMRWYVGLGAACVVAAAIALAYQVVSAA